MTETRPDQLVLEELPGYAPEVGRWIWAMQDNRRRTLETLAGIAPDALDRAPEGHNTIGTLLYHIAAIEVDWLYVDTLGQDFPPEVVALFPHDVRDSDGRLTPGTGVSLDEHLERLAAVRRRLLDAFSAMTVEQFRRPRSMGNYDVTPEWVLYHLIEHEAAHRGEIGELRTWAERAEG